jgi:predicted Rossmann fold flavoprotein
MDPYAAVIIGAGPAGLFCAARAAAGGRRILVLEKTPSPGRKLLLSGSGQCNVTHDGEMRDFPSHYGDNGRFLKPALMAFSNRDLISFLAGRGVPVSSEPGGKIFPVTRKAGDILRALLEACAEGKVEVRCGCAVEAVAPRSVGFLVRTSRGELLADRLVLATGGMTYPQTGSTGDGYEFARRLGHTVTETAPALTPVAVRDYRFSDLAGISFASLPLRLDRRDEKPRRHSGDLLFTHTGLSGPGILDFSRFIRPGDILRVSFLPGLDAAKIKADLLDRIAAAGRRRVRSVLTGYGLPERFIVKILETAGIAADLTGAHLSRTDRAALIDLLTEFPFTVSRLGGVKEAMATRGGVRLEEIDSQTMESRLAGGLYIIGEVLDVDGDSGGYNIQAAFSTAAKAARSLAAT